jgi:PAS domain S-box-containing protein
MRVALASQSSSIAGLLQTVCDAASYALSACLEDAHCVVVDALDPSLAAHCERARSHGARTLGVAPLDDDAAHARLVDANVDLLVSLPTTAAALRAHLATALSRGPRPEDERLRKVRLEAQEERYRALFESTLVGFWHIDAQGNTRYMNNAMALMLELPSPAASLGQSYRPFFTEESLGLMAEEHRKRSFGVASSYEVELVGAKGGRRRAIISGAPVRSRAGEIEGLIGTFVDVTERHRIESRLMASDRLASMGRLAAGMAHEINNPLTFLLVNLGLLQEDLDAAIQRGTTPSFSFQQQLLAECREGAERVRSIVHDLKSLARGDEDRREPIDLVAVVQAACNMLGDELRHRAKLRMTLEPVPRVSASASRLSQVVINLLSNAAEAFGDTPAERREVHVAVRPDGSHVVLEVEDTGTGMPRAVLDRVFDPFFTTKPIGHGMGLGLAICHGIVTDLGGEITAESDVGKGTRLRVRLPAIPEHASRAPSSPTPRADLPRVLVVDDEPVVGTSLARLLSADNDVVVELDAKGALERIRCGERFDVILCDLMMPEMSGMDFQRELEHRWPELAERTVFMTGGAFTPQAQAFVERHAARRLDKPFQVTQLRQVIARVSRDGP